MGSKLEEAPLVATVSKIGTDIGDGPTHQSPNGTSRQETPTNTNNWPRAVPYTPTHPKHLPKPIEAPQPRVLRRGRGRPPLNPPAPAPPPVQQPTTTTQSIQSIPIGGPPAYKASIGFMPLPKQGMIGQRFGMPPSFTTNPSIPATTQPIPAHSSNHISQAPMCSRPKLVKLPQSSASILNNNSSNPQIRQYAGARIRPTFVPQATAVRPAFEDFLRQVQSISPAVDINQILQQITNNPSQPIKISVPNGIDTTQTQQQLQQSLETSMFQALNPQLNPQFNPQLNSHPQMGFQQPNTVFSHMNDLIQGILTNKPGPQINHQPQPPRKPAPPPPSEDDMAKQDLEVGANHDEEYHEVETYADYVPSKLTFGQPHPDPVVETSSLSTVQPPDIYYDMKLPKDIIEKGLLSALQLESVIYACQQHDQYLADNATKRGFLIGDGAGVGKGRTIAGIIFENYLNGRKKSIWLSVSTDLKLDAERDLKDIGASKIPVHLLGKFSYGRKIHVESGVIFTTYSGLVSKSQSIRGSLGSRLEQLISWVGPKFEGVIVFDECHKAKNIAVSPKTQKTQSKAAAFALQLQDRLPKARVVYASATGASETKHLGYMTRLGIWGQGTAYGTFSEFCGAIEKRGVGAMELVAVDLKMRGSYIARQLSFKTTSFEIRIANLDTQFTQLYDECADMWAHALRSFSEAACYINDRKQLRTIWASFWAAHQKFFKYLCIGAKVPLVVQIVEQALLDKKCVVIGLQSTGEAKAIEALEDGDINEFISTAKATFESLIENHFPAPPVERRRPQPRARQTPDNSSTRSSESETDGVLKGSSSGSSYATTINADNYAVNDDVKFVVEDGLIKAKLDENEASRSSRRKSKLVMKKDDSEQPTDEASRKRWTKNQQALEELAELARSRKARSTRAERAKRRATARAQAKSRLRLVDDSSDDTELSNPLSSNSNTNSPSDEDDSSYIESNESEYSTDELEEENESDYEKNPPKKVNRRKQNLVAQTSTKKDILDSGSDSDIQITAVKSRPKNFEIITLESSDEDDVRRKDPLIRHRDRLIELRDQMYNLIDKVGPKLPNNTLDDLIDRLGGPSKVAEMTGRKGRVVKDEDGMISYRQRNEADALENLNIAEKERFMNGEKFIAIISEAASSGISLQADKRVKNKRRRVHITIELPWSADRAIQQFGRSHRSNQLSGPEYVFIISELAGEKRFASIVAKRLESLGALTHGDRRANTDTRDLSQFNLIGRYSKQALDLLCRYLDNGLHFADIRPDYEGNFLQDARDAYVGAGLGKYTGTYFSCETNATQVSHFLNRLLGMKVRVQNALFKMFSEYMEKLIARHKVNGQYDAGILELNSESGKTRCDLPEDYFLKTKFGPIKCTLRNVQIERGISWEEASSLYNDAKDQKDTRSGFYISYNRMTKSKLICLLLREPNLVDMFRVFKPNIGRQPKPENYSFLTDKDDIRQVKVGEAEPLWRMIFDATDTKCVHLCIFNSCKRIEARLKCDVGLRHRKYCILSGGILTAWPYLEQKAPEVTSRLRIVRLRLDTNNRVIGKC